MKLKAFLGRVAFKLSIPILQTIVPRSSRTRAVLYHRGKILLIKNLVSPKQKWTLPGGGIKRGETPDEGVQREVYEELKIVMVNFQKVAKIKLMKSGLEFNLDCYLSEVNTPNFKAEKLEILDANWFPLNSLPNNRSTLVDKVLIKSNLQG